MTTGGSLVPILIYPPRPQHGSKHPSNSGGSFPQLQINCRWSNHEWWNNLTAGFYDPYCNPHPVCFEVLCMCIAMIFVQFCFVSWFGRVCGIITCVMVHNLVTICGCNRHWTLSTHSGYNNEYHVHTWLTYVSFSFLYSTGMITQVIIYNFFRNALIRDQALWNFLQISGWQPWKLLAIFSSLICGDMWKRMTFKLMSL